MKKSKVMTNRTYAVDFFCKKKKKFIYLQFTVNFRNEEYIGMLTLLNAIIPKIK